jgi:hypothetical protein
MPTETSRPARKIQRVATSPAADCPVSGLSAAVGTGCPTPTAKATTPDSRCPSSETIDQRTE